ncbi:MAG: DUF1700 domain-containing protein [Clostridia bacterium]|nr:DUF1700 domain-containing protein [Clostridia bacterium]
MNKQEFLDELRKGLSCLPPDDAQERLAFYGEMIDDRIEEGLSEADAVDEIGSVERIVSQIVSEVPLTKLVREKVRSKCRLRAWEIVLLALGSPLWLPLLLAFFAVVLCLYITVWAVLISLWTVMASLGVCAAVGAAAAVMQAIRGSVYIGAELFGVSLVSAGLCIFLFFGCKAATKGVLHGTKKIVLKTKSRFVGKEDA